MEHRVVITGIAPVTGMGIGKEEFFERLLKKDVCICRLPENYSKGYDGFSKWYVPFPDIDYDSFGSPIAKMNAKAPLVAKATVASALLAVADAEIESIDEDAAVVYGASVHNAPEMVRAYRSIAEETLMHPFTIPLLIPNTISAWVSMALGIHGPSHVITTACASGTSAIGEAYLSIREGRAKTAVCGGVDCMVDEEGLIYKGFDALGVLTRSEEGFPYPFSEERSGFLYNEGAACTLILEELETARQRNAKIYAEITGYESSCDAWHIVQMDPAARQIIKMLSKLTADEKIDYYNAHGTGTNLNDQTEAEIIKTVFASYEKGPYVNSTKGFIGHSLAASGAIEAAVCSYTVKNDVIHGNIMKTPLEGIELPVDPVRTEVNTAVSASYGFGGHNAVLKFRKYVY